jgi:hypothetical protein
MYLRQIHWYSKVNDNTTSKAGVKSNPTPKMIDVTMTA